MDPRSHLAAISTEGSALAALPFDLREEGMLGDAMEGDAELFARQDGVEAQWRVIDPILGDAVPVAEYAPGTWGPEAAAKLAAPVGGWHDPG